MSIMTQTRDQLEYAISQYLDGTLPPLETAALEERLAVDADARALLEEYRALNQALKRAPLPAVAWDRLAVHLAEVVSDAEPPVKISSLFAMRRSAGVALAACLAVVLGIGFASYQGAPDRSPIIASGQPAPPPQPIAIVVGPQAERTGGRTAVAQVSIGPAPTMSDSWRYAETVVSRPAVVLIDRAQIPAQDTDVSPF